MGTRDSGDSSSPAPRYVTVQGAKLAYFEWGTGEPVLFVHGSVSDHRFWMPQVQALAQHYRCIALDLGHFGQSRPAPGQPFGMAVHARELAQSIGMVTEGPIHAVATSYGGGVLLASALAEPSRFKSLFLHEPFLPSAVTAPEELAILAQGRGGLSAVFAALAQHDQAGAVARFVDWIASAGAFALLPEPVQAMALENGHTVALQLASEPSSVTASQLVALAMPVQITVGEDTRPFFLVQAQALHRSLPDSRLSRLAGVGHNASLEDPAQFNVALLAHLHSLS